MIPDENKQTGIDIFSPLIQELLRAVPKTSGIDEGMLQEEYRHRELLLLAYIADQLEHLSKLVNK